MPYKKIAIFLFITLIDISIQTQILKAQQDQLHDYNAIFEKANMLYKEGKHEDAMELYKKIPDKSAAVNYNLGNCAYKLNKLGFALLYWRRAEKDWGFFGRTELLNNMKLLREQLKPLKTEKQKDLVLIKAKNLHLHIASFIRATPLFIFQIVFLFFWIFLFVFIRNLLVRKKRLLIGTLFTFIAISGLMLVSKYNFEYKQFGIVTVNNAKLLSGPGDNFQVLSSVQEAKEVIIQKTSSGFYKIKVDGLIGWLSQEAIEKI
jgi:tetratricopeptide (TPR) repeat protein